MTVTIDALTEREFFAWYSLYTEYAAGEGITLTDEQVIRVWTRLQEPGAIGLAARDESDGVVGLAHAVPFERLLPGGTGTHIEDVYVAPKARRGGVATALVEHLRSRAESESRPLLRWQARADDPAAKALQEKFAASAAGWVLATLPVG